MVALTWVLGAMPPALLDVFETDTCRVTQMFGMAEGLCMYTPRWAPLDLRLRSVGTPYPRWMSSASTLPAPKT
jgi:2,3-dihydroxybenzoate-AMP ligase